MNSYIPNTPADVKLMLERCGMTELDELMADVPEHLRLTDQLHLHEAMTEAQVMDFMEGLAGENTVMTTCLAGAGVYDHYTPAVIPSLVSRSEFTTAYTPYQPEISQGTLRYIFEYQSMMTQLTGLDVSNASMYDSATATAEAMLMTVAATRKRRRVLVSATINPDVRRVVDTYASYQGIEIDTIAEADGVTSIDHMRMLLEKGDVAGVILAQPNYYGIVEDLSGVADAIHAAKALMVMNCHAITLATLRTPGEWGADIACGDAQSLGIPMSFGGPYLGYLTTTKALMRKMPGRIVGATTDAAGNRAFVLTLQAREQHIRRNKATSNICSNQGMMTLWVTIYAALHGAEGLRAINAAGHDATCYLVEKLTATGLMWQAFPTQPFLNEVVMETSIDLDELQRRCTEEGILAGVKLAPGRLMIAATERQSRGSLDRFIAIVQSMMPQK